MKKLVDNSDMGIPYTTLLNKAVVRIAQSVLGINKLNALYAKTDDKENAEFAQAVLDELGVKIHSDEGRRLAAIPRTGPFIVVANHPHGALDGLLLIVLIAGIRPDVKFLGNFLLSRIEELKEFFLPVDSFHLKEGRNIAGVRCARTHLEQGSPLIIFPAGEVSTYQKGFGKVEDRSWSDSLMKFIKQAGVPVVPVYIDGRNSLKYQLLGKIHPLLQMARLPLELMNKEGQSVSVAFGTQVETERLENLPTVRAVSDFLRANVYCLKAMLTDEAERAGKTRLLPGGRARKRIAQESGRALPEELPVSNRELIRQELEGVAGLRLAEQIGEMQLFIAPASDIPLTISEINRLKNRKAWQERRTEGELEEKEAGELYGHLVVWDSSGQSIVAAYRLGYGDNILKNRGFEGLYTYEHFEFSKGINQMLHHALELGQSFVQFRHPRISQALLLLWRGFLKIWLTESQCRYLVSTIELTEGYSAAAKRLLVDFIQANYWNDDLARYVLPRYGVSALGKPVAEEALLRGIRTDEEIDKLLRDIEPSRQGMPILMKKYLQWGGRVAGFNLDPDKGEALDVLLVLDLKNVPQAQVKRMIRDFSGEDIAERFRSVGNLFV